MKKPVINASYVWTPPVSEIIKANANKSFLSRSRQCDIKCIF